MIEENPNKSIVVVWSQRTMQRKFHFHVKDKGRDNGSIRAKARTSVGSVFSSVLGNKKSLGKYLSRVKKNGDSENGTEWPVAARNELARGGVPVPEPEPVVAALSQLLALEQTLEHDRADERKQNRNVKMNILVPLLSFLDKNKGWNNFIRAKLRTVKFSDLHGDSGVATRFGQVRKRVSSWRLVRIRIPSKLVVIRLKLKMIRSVMKKKVTKQFEEGAGEDSDRELCKKRILMGGRCKPLCSSGTLSYDSDGIFLPEIAP